MKGYLIITVHDPTTAVTSMTHAHRALVASSHAHIQVRYNCTGLEFMQPHHIWLPDNTCAGHLSLHTLHVHDNMSNMARMTALAVK